MSTGQHDWGNGKRRKADVLALLAGKREDVMCRAQRALLEVLLERGTATIDDVRQRITLPPAISPKCFGAVPGPLNAGCKIIPICERQTTMSGMPTVKLFYFPIHPTH